MKKYGELHAWEHHINPDNDDVDEDGDNISEKMCKEIASRCHLDLDEAVALVMSANHDKCCHSFMTLFTLTGKPGHTTTIP